MGENATDETVAGCVDPLQSLKDLDHARCGAVGVLADPVVEETECVLEILGVQFGAFAIAVPGEMAVVDDDGGAVGSLGHGINWGRARQPPGKVPPLGDDLSRRKS